MQDEETTPQNSRFMPVRTNNDPRDRESMTVEEAVEKNQAKGVIKCCPVVNRSVLA